MSCRTCVVQIQPRKPVLGHEDYTAVTRKLSWDHTDLDHEEGMIKLICSVCRSLWLVHSPLILSSSCCAFVVVDFVPDFFFPVPYPLSVCMSGLWSALP